MCLTARLVNCTPDRFATLSFALFIHAEVHATSAINALIICFFFLVVDGNYSEWSEFQTCSVTCGKGIQSRTRSCINPPPQHGGKNCSGFGLPVETKECRLRECPSMII